MAETRRPQIYPVLTDAELKRIGHISPIVEIGPGELAELSDKPALVDVRAMGDVDALIIAPDGLRALMVAEAELGERILRSLILRRVHLIEANAAGPTLVGELTLPDMIRLQDFLTRNGQHYSVIDPERDPDAAQMIARLSPDPEDYPRAVCPDGTVLRNPSEQELAICIGLLDRSAEPRIYDIAIVGAGPASLSTAVYAASEGLQVLVVETRAFGGQAGASNRIENYLGFPTGISGQALTARAFVQAQKFGARFVIPLTVARLDCSSGLERPMTLEMGDGWRVQARTVVIASGTRYRKLSLPNLGQFQNRGIWYCMSRYLIDRIEAAPNIEVLAETEVAERVGSEQDGLQKVRWRNRTNGEDTVRPIRMSSCSLVRRLRRSG